MNLAILRISPGIIVWVLKSLSEVPGKVLGVLYKSIATGCSFVPISGTHMNYCYMKKKISSKKKEERRGEKKEENGALVTSSLLLCPHIQQGRFGDNKKKIVLKSWWLLKVEKRLKISWMTEIKPPALNRRVWSFVTLKFSIPVPFSSNS